MTKYEFVNTKAQDLKSAIQNQLPNISNKYFNKLLKNKDIRVNFNKVSENLKLVGDEKICIYYDLSLCDKIYDNIYEDENILIVFKYAGIEVCDGTWNLLNILNKNNKYFSVHRIDRNTEGLVMFAKNQKTKTILDKAIKSGKEIEKTYTAQCVGTPKLKTFTDKRYLVKDSKKSIVKIYDNKVNDSVEIQTSFKTLSSSNELSLLQIKLHTGKTHQIRAHSAYLGFPILGDEKYGNFQVNKKYKTTSQNLTASGLKFSFNDPYLKYLNDLNFVVSPTWIIHT